MQQEATGGFEAICSTCMLRFERLVWQLCGHLILGTGQKAKSSKAGTSVIVGTTLNFMSLSRFPFPSPPFLSFLFLSFSLSFLYPIYVLFINKREGYCVLEEQLTSCPRKKLSTQKLC